MTRSSATAQAGKPAVQPHAIAKTAVAGKPAQVRTAQLAKPAAPPQPAPVAQVPSPAKAVPARQPNGAGQASTKVGAPAVAT
jgi:hypothetical protein